MPDERTAETPPGTPGQRALGAMESAVRRARESAGDPPLPPPPLARAQPTTRRVEAAPPREEQRPPAAPREGLRTTDTAPPARPDRWLIGSVSRGRRPRRGGRHRVDRLVERQLGSVVLDGAHGGQATTMPSHSPLKSPRSGAARGDHTDTSPPTPSTTTTVAGRSGRPARDLLAESRQRHSRAERDGVRRQLLEHDRSDRGDLQRSSGADELPRSEHLHGHRAVVERALCSGSDHHRRRRVQCGDLHLQLSTPQQFVDLLVGSRGEVAVPLAYRKERIRIGDAEHVVAHVLER